MVTVGCGANSSAPWSATSAFHTCSGSNARLIQTASLIPEKSSMRRRWTHACASCRTNRHRTPAPLCQKLFFVFPKAVECVALQRSALVSGSAAHRTRWVARCAPATWPRATNAIQLVPGRICCARCSPRPRIRSIRGTAHNWPRSWICACLVRAASRNVRPTSIWRDSNRSGSSTGTMRTACRCDRESSRALPKRCNGRHACRGSTTSSSRRLW